MGWISGVANVLGMRIEDVVRSSFRRCMYWDRGVGEIFDDLSRGWLKFGISESWVHTSATYSLHSSHSWLPRDGQAHVCTMLWVHETGVELWPCDLIENQDVRQSTLNEKVKLYDSPASGTSDKSTSAQAPKSLCENSCSRTMAYFLSCQ